MMLIEHTEYRMNSWSRIGESNPGLRVTTALLYH